MTKDLWAINVRCDRYDSHCLMAITLRYLCVMFHTGTDIGLGVFVLCDV